MGFNLGFKGLNNVSRASVHQMKLNPVVLNGDVDIDD